MINRILGAFSSSFSIWQLKKNEKTKRRNNKLIEELLNFINYYAFYKIKGKIIFSIKILQFVDKMKKGVLIIASLLFSNLSYLYAQSDSLVLNNGNVIVGEAKELNKGVLTMKTNYSDSDFKIEWLGIKEIFTESYYTITMSYGTIYYGRLITSKPNRVLIIEGTDSLEVNFEEVV